MPGIFLSFCTVGGCCQPRHFPVAVEPATLLVLLVCLLFGLTTINSTAAQSNENTNVPAGPKWRRLHRAFPRYFQGFSRFTTDRAGRVRRFPRVSRVEYRRVGSV